MNNSEGAFERALRVLRRRKLVFVVALIAVPLAAFLFSSTQQKEYTATATLLFESGENASFEASREAATNEALAGLPAVAVRAAKALGGGFSIDEVLGSVSASSANEMANLTTISATTPDPQRSAEIANAYSRAYITFRREADQAQIKRAIALVEHSLEDLSPEKAEGPQGAALRERLDQLEVERALKTGRTELVQTAGVPSVPSAPRTRRNVIVGVVVGVLLGLLLIALLERIDRRVRTLEELEELFGLPVLARIPRSRVFAHTDIGLTLQAPEAEAFWTLRTNLRYFKVDRDIQTILIASPEPADGKSTVARGLAGAMASMGDSVVLVEADLRKGSSFRSAAGLPSDGLSSVLAGAPLEGALIEISVTPVGADEQRALPVLPSGPAPPNPSELLESERMRELMKELGERFETIVLDTPALGVLGDALTLVPLSSEILAVGGLGKTTRDGVSAFMKQLAVTGKQPLGFVATLTEFDKKQYAYYRRPGSVLRG